MMHFSLYYVHGASFYEKEESTNITVSVRNMHFMLQLTLSHAAENVVSFSLKKVLTISVSDTGPKLVTKMLVLISVTFSVKIE